MTFPISRPPVLLHDIVDATPGFSDLSGWWGGKLIRLLDLWERRNAEFVRQNPIPHYRVSARDCSDPRESAPSRGSSILPARSMIRIDPTT
jgi:hypothetical protein